MSQTAVIGRAAESFVIEGGRPLNGRIRASGNKNGALPILAACLLTAEPVRLHNVPRIVDVETMIELLNDIGVEADWIGPNDVQVHASEVDKHELDEELCSRMRAQIDIGRRYERRGGSLRGKPIFLDEASVMATENAVMAATLTPGETVIGNAACEPHVQDLCRFLISLGAQIEGIESNVLHIQGVDALRGGDWEVGPDHIEVGSFIGLAAITGGDVTIDGVKQADLVSILHGFEKFGVQVERGEDLVRVPPRQELVVQDDLGGHVPKIEDGPWPAFPSDLTSVALTIATQAQGTILMFEKMFENRLFFTDKLVSMGARIILCDPHRAVVTGPAKLRGQRMESPDIRAGMAMLLASLCAEGSSTIGAVYQIDKGYERIDERLRSLGAQIDRVDV